MPIDGIVARIFSSPFSMADAIVSIGIELGATIERFYSNEKALNIKENFEKAEEYLISEDYMWETLKKKDNK